MTTTPSVTRKTARTSVVLALAGNVDRHRRTRARGGRGFAASALGQRREARDPRSFRAPAHGHRRRVVHRSRPGGTDGRRGAVSCYRGERPEHAILLKDAGYHPPEAPTRSPPPHAHRAALGGRRDGLRIGRRFHRHRRLSRRNRRDVPAPRPAAVALALDLDGASPRDVRAAQRADHHADQLSGRRDRHPAGHFPARELRRLDLRGRSGRRSRLARAWRADDLDHDRRAAPDRRSPPRSAR